LDENVFFTELSTESGLDIETCKRLYLAMVRVINRRVFEKYVIRLPHLGDFALVMRAESLSCVGKTRQVLPPKRTLKFYPLDKWTGYIYKKLGYSNKYWQ